MSNGQIFVICHKGFHFSVLATLLVNILRSLMDLKCTFMKAIVKRHGGAQGNVMANVDGRVNGHVMTNDLSQD